MRIGELAERTGLSLRTVRFDEQLGVLASARVEDAPILSEWRVGL